MCIASLSVDPASVCLVSVYRNCLSLPPILQIVARNFFVSMDHSCGPILHQLKHPLPQISSNRSTITGRKSLAASQPQHPATLFSSSGSRVTRTYHSLSLLWLRLSARSQCRKCIAAGTGARQILRRGSIAKNEATIAHFSLGAVPRSQHSFQLTAVRLYTSVST